MVLIFLSGAAVGMALVVAGFYWWFYAIRAPKFLIYTQNANQFRAGDLLLIANEICEVYDVVDRNLLVARRVREKSLGADKANEIRHVGRYDIY